MTTTEVLNLLLLAQLSNISLYSSEQQLPLYTFSGQLYKSEEHKLHFIKAEKEVLFRNTSAEGVFENTEKMKLHSHATPSLPHTLDIFLEQQGHCTSPTASRHGDFIPTSSTKEDAFGST